MRGFQGIVIAMREKPDMPVVLETATLAFE